jgi:hypothetical protein
MSSYDNLFMGFSIDTDLGLLILKDRIDSDYIELEMYDEETKHRFILPQNLDPAYYIKDKKT